MTSRGVAVFAGVCLAALLAFAGSAAADVRAEFVASETHDHVQLSIVASDAGGRFSLPVGTILTTGQASQQDLAVGEAIEIELAPGERRTLRIATYCLDSHRASPTQGIALRRRGRPDPTLVRLITALRRIPHEVVQSAVWSYRNADAPTDPMVVKVFEAAGVVPKQR